MTTKNPLLKQFSTPHASVPFNNIKLEHYMLAFTSAIKDAKKEISRISNLPDKPDFKNTIESLEYATYPLDKITAIFFNLNHAHTNEKMQEMARKILPMLTDFYNDIGMNEKLFKKVKQLYEKKDELNLSVEQKQLLLNKHKFFIKAGANLDAEDKKNFRKITKNLSELSLQFEENVLAASNNFELHLTQQSELSGLPNSVVEVASALAKEKKKEGWIFNLQAPSYVPFMQYASNRELRMKMSKAYHSRCFEDSFDNQEIIRKIVNLSLEKAKLLGHETYAHCVLEDRMAKSPIDVMEFLNKLLETSMPQAEKERADLQEYANSLGVDFELQKWDWAYYAEKFKTERFAVNDEMTRPYFELKNTKKGIFNLAYQLYGIRFKQNHEIQKYHEEVEVYEVFDEKGNFLALFYADFHPRPTKQSGAWMTSFSEQFNREGKNYFPHICIVCNFTRPTKNKPSLLSFSELSTFLHEFGHALHGILSKCTYASLSGTNVYRDFVELPSQFMENFAYQEQWLNEIAVHYETGEKMSEKLIRKIVKNRNFLSGYQFVRQIGFALNDMAWYSIREALEVPIIEFERMSTSSARFFPNADYDCMSTSFSHIFSGGYAAGYYAYKWAEVLDADAFEMFEAHGIYDKKTANLFRKHVLERGGSEHPMDLYIRFRGKEPSIKALLKRIGN